MESSDEREFAQVRLFMDNSIQCLATCIERENPMDFLTILSGVLGGGLVVPAAVWYLRTFIARKIDHDFDTKLESFKSSLADSSAALACAASSMIARQSAAHERTLEATEDVWRVFLDQEKFNEPCVLILDGPKFADPEVHYMKQRAPWNELLENWLRVASQGADEQMTSGSEFVHILRKHWPLLGDRVFFEFMTTHLIRAAVISLLVAASETGSFHEWWSDETLMSLISRFEDKNIQLLAADRSSPYRAVHFQIKKRLASLLGKIQRGEELSELTLAQANHLGEIALETSLLRQ